MNTALNFTPNRRLARFLHQQEKGRFVSWSDWLLHIWQTEYELIVGEQPLQCLSDWQSALLWEEVITALHKDPLLNKTQAVQHARQAWALAIQWQSDPSFWRGEKSETDVFLQWLDAYQHRCAQKSWLDLACLPERLLRYWESHPEQIPSEVNFRGFDEFTPLHHAIIALWKQHGAQVYIEEASIAPHPYTYLCFSDKNSELIQAALHAKHALASSPELPIGIIIPAIQDDWANIHDTLTKILGPEQPFNISAGQPLGQCPIIYAAIECLRAESLRYLLKTPYITGGLSEQSARALCDLKLSQLEKDPLPLSFVKSHSALPEQFKNVLEQALNHLDNVRQLSRCPSAWIEEIFSLLTLWGWPGERILNSEAYQAVTHFYGLISELSSLDDLLGKISYSSMLSLFSQRLNQTMFQAESEDKPIQVLGFLEAAGISFSHLWVMDMGSDSWPAKPSPNPFIPMSIQIKLGIPHASFARELRFAQTMTQRMLTCSPNIIMSYAMHAEGGEAAVLPTPLLEQEPIPAEFWGEREYRDLTQQLYDQGALVPMSDPLGLPLNQGHMKGGSSVFKDQADCPFRAYAKHRLSAIAPERPRMGLSERVKGSVLHEVLDRVWSSLKTREALLNLGGSGLQELLREMITLTLSGLSPPLISVERDLELRRLLPLLTHWFERELERDHFEILALEQEQTVSLEGLSMTLRIDRIDRINGKLCIIDYKTSEVTPKSWLAPRMDEPQLPLYACVHKPEPQSIAFAQIRKNDMALKFLDELDIEGWKQAFSELATEFKQGHAAVLPKRGSTTCTYCELQSFCRINHAD